MYDPDALYPQRCRHDTDADRARRNAEYLDRHMRWLAARAPLEERDRRFRRVGQTLLAAFGLVALVGLGVVLWSISAYLDGESLGVVDTLAAKVTIPGLFTTFGVLRMAWAWHKRRSAPTVVRAADAAASLLPPTR